MTRSQQYVNSKQIYMSWIQTVDNQTLLHDNERGCCFNTDSNSNTLEYRQKVMKLASLNVTTCNVNDEVNTSFNLVGKYLENCPSKL